MQNIDPFEQVFDKGIDKNIAGQFCGDIQHLSIALYVIRFPLQLQSIAFIRIYVFCFHLNITMDPKEKDFNKITQKHLLFYYSDTSIKCHAIN